MEQLNGLFIKRNGFFISVAAMRLKMLHLNNFPPNYRRYAAKLGA